MQYIVGARHKEIVGWALPTVRNCRSELLLAIRLQLEVEGMEHRGIQLAAGSPATRSPCLSTGQAGQASSRQIQSDAGRGRHGDRANAFRFRYSFVAMRPFNFRHFSSI